MQGFTNMIYIGTRQNSFGEVVNECLPKADAAREYTPIFAPISERWKNTP
jgi:hypothetical protein